nr:MAG TPA: hypothetical protein [Caudoviricetes sp.]
MGTILGDVQDMSKICPRHIMYARTRVRVK